MIASSIIATPVGKKRSFARRLAGKMCYRFLRHMQRLLSPRRFAAARSAALLPYQCAGHHTPLIRSLANVDMWMQRNKITNLRIAAKKVNGIVLKPGETFSFWKLVGKPSARKGYLPGMVLCGGAFRAGVGGGLCQLTNLIYWMALHTPLTVVERHRHSYDVFPDSNRSQPFGSGATCSYNYLDLQVRNDTDAAWQLVVEVGGGELLGQWRSEEPSRLRYEVYERDARIVSNAWGGYVRHNEIWRSAFDLEGRQVRDEFITENNAMMMYQPYLEAGKTTGEGDGIV